MNEGEEGAIAIEWRGHVSWAGGAMELRGFGRNVLVLAPGEAALGGMGEWTAESRNTTNHSAIQRRGG
jgi:hypothetical protein